MRPRFAQLALYFAVTLLAVITAQPLTERAFITSPTSRSVQPRGSLSDIESLTIKGFERVSPSVGQVAGRTATPGPVAETVGSGAACGTGFVWDGAGHVVTNDHVVQQSA